MDNGEKPPFDTDTAVDAVDSVIDAAIDSALDDANDSAIDTATIETEFANNDASCNQNGAKTYTYNELPIATKVDVIRDYESEHFSQRALARKYKISRATVNQILKQRHRYVAEFEKMRRYAVCASYALVELDVI